MGYFANGFDQGKLTQFFEDRFVEPPLAETRRWIRRLQMTDMPKGRFTFRFAAVCFGLSAAWELLTLQDEALLFGQLVGGIGVVPYHVVYGALFAYLAIGLWIGWRSGYYALIVTSCVYTIDRLQGLFVGDGLATQIRQQLAGHPELLQVVSVDYLLQVSTAAILAILLCWWGFVGFAYYRRAYFGIRRES